MTLKQIEIFDVKKICYGCFFGYENFHGLILIKTNMSSI